MTYFTKRCCPWLNILLTSSAAFTHCIFSFQRHQEWRGVSDPSPIPHHRGCKSLDYCRSNLPERRGFLTGSSLAEREEGRSGVAIKKRSSSKLPFCQFQGYPLILTPLMSQSLVKISQLRWPKVVLQVYVIPALAVWRVQATHKSKFCLNLYHLFLFYV